MRGGHRWHQDVRGTLAVVFLSAVNLGYVRDARQFSGADLVSLLLIDVFFPAAAFACGLVSWKFLGFTCVTFVAGFLYVSLAAASTLHS